MKQVVQDYRSGKLRLEDVPVPICKPGGVVVRAAYSLVSSGTERMKVSQARMNLVQMAKARPDKVRQVLTSMRQIGLKETVNKVRERLETLTPLGYSLAGTVVEVGAGVDEFAVGDRVACAGEGIACHAEFVFVPRNLCAAVPKNVAMEDAAFTTVGAIALNGVRQAEVSIGDSVLVVGLGLVGLLAVQLLKAAGCRVLGVDVDAGKVSLAKECGAMAAFARDDDALEDSIRRLTDGLGGDCVYLAASTRHTDPMELAGKVTRDRGRIVVVGKVPLEGDWQTYYGKELSVVMSRSYGPGRYDRNYEQKGIDYPVGYVRWTEQRNMGAFLQLMAEGRVSPGRLGPESFDITDAPEAYEQLHTATAKHATGILFRYPQDAPLERRVEVGSPREFLPSKTGAVDVGVVGAGNFVTATLIPVLKRIPCVNLRAICSAGGLSARSASQRHGFERAVTEFQDLLDDDRIQSIVIGTRHDTHARFAAEALRAGKHVFVEKPLALTREQLDTVLEAHRESGKILMPGFNRRFSPLSIAVRDFFSNRAGPIEVICRVNAGELRADSWYQDSDEGGWRVISEGCHFVDLIQFICGCPPVRVQADMVGGHTRGEQNDNCVATLTMADGSLGVLIYVANGDPGYEKERIEVFGQGRTGLIENWRVAKLSGGGRTKTIKPKGTGKGHGAELRAFIDAQTNGRPSPLPFDEAVACTLATFAIVESRARGAPVALESTHVRQSPR